MGVGGRDREGGLKGTACLLELLACLLGVPTPLPRNRIVNFAKSLLVKGGANEDRT